MISEKRRSYMKRATITVIAAFALMLVVGAGVAMAQATRNGYETVGGQVQDDVQGDTGPSNSQSGDDRNGTAPVAASGNSGGGGLPFTGLDVALLAGAGALLAAAGLGMRRLTRAPDSV
jgi:hypothetical protein